MMTDRTEACTPEGQRIQELYDKAERAYEGEPKKFPNKRRTTRTDRD